MKCFACLVAFQQDEREDLSDAVYVYEGQSLCAVHVNTRRGLPESFQRYGQAAS